MKNMSHYYPPGTVRIPITHKGSLTEYGYHLRESDYEREQALLQALQHYDYRELIDKLLPLYTFNEYNHPDLAQIAYSDIEWLRQLHGEGQA